jgi:DNA-directed RNA polymerase specialized sigma24 family protein
LLAVLRDETSTFAVWFLKLRGFGQRLTAEALHRKVLRAATAVTRRRLPEQERDEIVQQALMTAWEKRANFNPSKGSFAAWVAGITDNLCSRWHAARKRERTRVVYAADLARQTRWTDEADDSDNGDGGIFDIPDPETPLDLLLAEEAALERLREIEEKLRGNGDGKRAAKRISAKLGIKTE